MSSSIRKVALRGIKGDIGFDRLQAPVVDAGGLREVDVGTLRKLSAEQLRKRYGIKLSQIQSSCLVQFKGSEKIVNMKPLISFEDLEQYLPARWTEYLVSGLHFTEPTPVQRAALPLAFSGQSFLAIAPTGSGKTLAFVLPVVLKLYSRAMTIERTVESPECGRCPKAMILSPTRELAVQTCRVIQNLIDNVDVDIKVTDISRLDKNSDIIVCTTGVTKQVLNYSRSTKSASMLGETILSRVETVVFDEVDALLDESFIKESDLVMSMCSAKQIMMFSASLPARVMDLANSLLINAPVLKLKSTLAAADSIEQELVHVANEVGKLTMLKQLLDERQLLPPCLVFVQDKDRAQMLEKYMKKNISMKGSDKPVPVGSLHSGLSPKNRISNLNAFRKGDLWILVCTDLAARGIDCVGVRCVLNFDLPTSREAYIHRIGRSGRAGLKGKSFTFYTEQDKTFIRVVASVMKSSRITVPKELDQCKKINTLDLIKHPPFRRPIGVLEGKAKYAFMKQRADQKKVQAVKKQRDIIKKSKKMKAKRKLMKASSNTVS
ncbi:helicase [Gregarina niphandrodes]|uniref:RNA helicase n=1 Tax=Gregarina niphandrodes TaxID=110365 RepID=A0A023B7H1_GRENI|nr:helicase [Gregarina niphandrodes]EZG67379.1 helicase [Gregarina niphandrodes]|eukprot:XP_011130260.1 helicase [Gregarina niphandrodes]